VSNVPPELHLQFKELETGGTLRVEGNAIVLLLSEQVGKLSRC